MDKFIVEPKIYYACGGDATLVINKGCDNFVYKWDNSLNDWYSLRKFLEKIIDDNYELFYIYAEDKKDNICFDIKRMKNGNILFKIRKILTKISFNTQKNISPGKICVSFKLSKREFVTAFYNVLVVLVKHAADLKYGVYRCKKRNPKFYFSKKIETYLLAESNNYIFQYNLEDAGWSNAKLIIDGKEIIFYRISYLCSPLFDLLTALINLIPEYDNEKKSSCYFEDEPGGYNWNFKLVNKKNIKLKITCLCGTRGNETEKDKTIYEGMVNLKYFVEAVVAGAEKTLKENGFMLFKERWETTSVLQFPIYEFLLLKYYVLYDKPFVRHSYEENQELPRNLNDDIQLLLAPIK
jgi:hypothetical protein